MAEAGALVGLLAAECEGRIGGPRPVGFVGDKQAKNREFEGLAVMWPYQVGGDVEHKRRLLYNAVTRAKRRCNIIVQSQNILGAAPFA